MKLLGIYLAISAVMTAFIVILLLAVKLPWLTITVVAILYFFGSLATLAIGTTGDIKPEPKKPSDEGRENVKEIDNEQ